MVISVQYAFAWRRTAHALDLFVRDARLAVEQVLPHALIELLAVSHRNGPFERAARELAQHVRRDVQAEERREWAEHGEDAHAEVAQRRELTDGALGELGVCQRE